jgi:ferredoxin
MPIDLYRTRLFGALLRRPYVQVGLQLLLLAGYVGLVLLGWGVDAIPGVPEAHPRIYTHASTLLFWVVWFMGLVFLAPVAGRAWCGVCPLGAAVDFVGRRGLGLSWPHWLSSGVGMIALFAAGVGAVVWGEIHKSPAGTAAFVAAVGALGLLSALVWRRSAFCKGLCPVGSALHLYSRHAPLEVRPLDPAGCRSCADRSCTRRQGGWRRWDVGSLVLQRRSYAAGCPVALYPPAMDMGACLLCLRCVRSCSHGNLGLYAGRRPAAGPLDRPRALLLVLLLGLVLLALLRTWPAVRDGITPGAFPAAWSAALWIGLALPSALLLGPAVLQTLSSWLRGRDAPEPKPGAAPGPVGARAPTGGFWNAALVYLPAFVGPVLGAHAAVALVKINAKAAYLPYLGYDPNGAGTYLAIHVAKSLALPDLLVPLSVLRWAALLCLGLGVLGGLREAIRRWPRGRLATVLYALSLATVGGLYGAALVHWLFPWGRG